MLSHVAACSIEAFEVLSQVEKFLVALVVIEGYDWDAVFELVSEGVDGIVDYYDVLETSRWQEDSQVFHVHSAFPSSDTAVPIKSLHEELVIRINEVKHHIGIGLVRCSEDYKLEHRGGSLETLQGEWSDVDARCGCFSARELHLNEPVYLARLEVLYAVDQSLV